MSQRLSFFSQPEKLWQVKLDSIYTVGDAGITESPNLNEKPCSFLCPRSELCLFGQSWIVKLTFGISHICLWCPPWPLPLLLHVSPLRLWYCHHSARRHSFWNPSSQTALPGIIPFPLFPSSFFTIKPCYFICYVLRNLVTHEFY